jgi:hypothetical protein
MSESAASASPLAADNGIRFSTRGFSRAALARCMESSVSISQRSFPDFLADMGAGCGKTQLSHTMAVIAQLPKDKGGAEGRVAVIDTEGTWRPERIEQISERFGSKASRWPSSLRLLLTPFSRPQSCQREHPLCPRREQRGPARSTLRSGRVFRFWTIPSPHHRQHHGTLPQ